jgi:putative ABC transport system ATP-binding protein
MSAAETPVLTIVGVRKAYAGLRPLRIKALTVAPAERVAVSGFDAAAAELLVNLVTGATLPDEGEIRVLGQRTADINDGDAWLASLDRFGILSPRAVMMESASVAQNLAMPFTLDIEPIPADIRARVARLAAECGIADSWLDRLVGDVPADVRVRAQLARAVALEPALLVMEHPTAVLPEDARAAFADVAAAVSDGRRLATLVITEDAAFARRAARRVLTLNGASGELAPSRRWLW